MKKLVNMLIFIALFTFFALPCAAEVVTVGSSDDALIWSERGENNYGTYTLFEGASDLSATWVRRGVLSFDLSAYAGQVVDGDATLTLRVDSSSTQTRGDDLNLYAIYAANAGWSEDYTTWDYRTLDAGGGVYENWVGSGGTGSYFGLGNPGDAYESSPIDSASIPGNKVPLSFTIPKAVIQSWIDSPGSNAGLLVRLADETTETDYVGLFSKEEATTSYRPLLEFTTNLAAVATANADSARNGDATDWAANINDANETTQWESDRNNDYVQNRWDHWVTLVWPDGGVMIDTISLINRYNYYDGNGHLAPRVISIEMWDGSDWVEIGSYTKTGTDVEYKYSFSFADIKTDAIKINISAPTGDAYDYINGLDAVEGENNYGVHNYDEWLVAPNNDQYDPGFNALGNEWSKKQARLAEVYVDGVLISECDLARERGLAGDLDKDCYVDFFDFAEFVNTWLTCNNPADANCN